MAWWARSRGEAYAEVAHLSRSGSNWQRVHELVVAVLAPDCLLRAWANQSRGTVGDTHFRDKLYELLTGIEQVDQRQPIAHWVSRGGVYLEFLRLENELRQLMQQQTNDEAGSDQTLGRKLERLDMRLRQLAGRVSAFESARRQEHANERPKMTSSACALSGGHVVRVGSVDRVALQEMACLTDLATRVSQFMVELCKMQAAVKCAGDITDDGAAKAGRLQRIYGASRRLGGWGILILLCFCGMRRFVWH
eukprot:TRINITY_DN52_c1_g1_i3.p2 TRINITY_DN52_c1_g1~~TRINITY_DN52_c1_g1_i3.p2  ORF type:complete len:250 (+),score=76.99 TRINITY_DN52_c1_g1_i3:1226-1975(+)